VAVNVNDKIRLSPARRKKVEARAAELIAEEMTLRELRRARKLTQVRMAKSLGVTQDGVSRLEKRSDLMLSTLRKTGRGHSPTVLQSCSPAFAETSRPIGGASVGMPTTD
jgi:DNA-binding XRE family transcriptional regulator